MFDFNSNVKSITDGTWLLQRARFGILVKPKQWLKLYVQAEDSIQVGAAFPMIPGKNGAEGNDAISLRQAFIELSDTNNCPFGLKIGRQILSYGDERLVGGFDWNNFARTFDAAKLTYKGNGFSVDGFASSPVVIWNGKFNQNDLSNNYSGMPDRNLIFSGLYLTIDPLPFGTWDLYTFMLDQANGNLATQEGAVTAAPVKGSINARSDFATFGTRLKGDPKKLMGWEFGTEAAYQTGKVRGLDLNAFAATAGAGYNWLGNPWKPRLYLEYNVASGDDSGPNSSGKVSGNDINTFQNLFPTNHPFYGNMDLFSWQNLQNILLSSRITPYKTVTLQLDYNAFWLENTNDAWYRANGITTVRTLNTAARNASPYAGSEIDFIATWNMTKYLQLQAGYSYFIAGTYLRDTGTCSNASLAYIQAKVTF